MNRLKIVVSDASVLMDLAKGRLIEATLALPYDFVIPETILLTELLDLGAYTSRELLRLGFRTAALDPEDTAAALTYFRVHRRTLSLNDCFAWRIAEVHGGILMTGDANLRTAAKGSGIEVHGTLWVAELISKHKTCTEKTLLKALDLLETDPTVFLPRTFLRAVKSRVSRKA